VSDATLMTPTPWEVSDGGHRFRGVAEDVLIVGNRHFAHDEDEDGPPCICDCDGGRDACDCREGCGWSSTAVALVLGNPTAGDIPKATAAELVRRVNAFPAMLAACKAMVAHLATKPADLTWDEEKELERPSFEAACEAIRRATTTGEVT
jgi:hypothetical protein